jgi:hypothetical protein
MRQTIISNQAPCQKALHQGRLADGYETVGLTIKLNI